MRFKNYIWQIIGIIVMISIGGSIVYSNAVTKKANEGITFEPHIQGNPDAEVTLIEYSDFQCPACGQFYAVLHDVMEKHGDDVRFEYKHFPLSSVHPFAIVAAKAAESAGQQGKFFEMHDKIFENQKIWETSTHPSSYFTTYATEIGLDVPLFKTQMKASVINDKIASEFTEAQGLGLTSTPSFFLNGQHMQFSTYQDFTDQIDAAVHPVVSTSTTPSEATKPPQSSGVHFGI